jgi:glyoxylase-like metal-dependent hydrolase (beta-lactamase superfamily II)/8-oxo-dGTP pyrophosphatase MutT (NUDIX family)
MAFAGGLFVFPGGAVDAADLDPALAARSTVDERAAFERLGGSTAPSEALALHLAALRELLEEAGILLAEPMPAPAAVAAAQADLIAGRRSFAAVCDGLDVRLRTDRLVPLSRWVTPAALPRRFDARFFAAGLPPGTAPTFLGDEVAGHVWLTPRAALEGLADGRVPMWMPTSSNLQRLVDAPDLAVVADRLASGPSGVPDVSDVAPDVVRLVLPSGAGVDGLDVNAYLVGGRSAIVVDPGDPSEEALVAIVEAATAAGAGIGGVALTSADPDHAGGCEHLLEELGVPVHGGAGSGRPLPCLVEELADGDAVPGGDVRLQAVPTPGPRPDHTAWWIPSSRTALVGDLLGGPPRSLPAPPDRSAWRASVERIRDLDPVRLLPAHGEPVEGRAAVARALGRRG